MQPHLSCYYHQLKYSLVYIRCSLYYCREPTQIVMDAIYLGEALRHLDFESVSQDDFVPEKAFSLKERSLRGCFPELAIPFRSLLEHDKHLRKDDQPSSVRETLLEKLRRGLTKHSYTKKTWKKVIEGYMDKSESLNGQAPQLLSSSAMSSSTCSLALHHEPTSSHLVPVTCLLAL